MSLEKYLKLRKIGRALGEIQNEYGLSESTVYALELGYQCFLKRLPLDNAIEIIKSHWVTLQVY